MASNFRFRITGLSLENIREIESVALEFEPDAINPLLIRNGYGKTTMLTLLRWMFTGVIPSQSGSNWPQYKRDFGGDTAESKVVLKLKISDAGDVLRDWELTMWFNHEDGDCGFETYSSEVGGRQAGWHLPPAFRSRFFGRQKFTELFIFDGETAKELTSGQGRNQIEDAILELTGLVHVKDISMDGGGHRWHRNAEFKKAAINDWKMLLRSTSIGNPRWMTTSQPRWKRNGKLRHNCLFTKRSLKASKNKSAGWPITKLRKKPLMQSRKNFETCKTIERIWPRNS